MNYKAIETPGNMSECNEFKLLNQLFSSQIFPKHVKIHTQ